jgi:hypothetical protein
MTSSATSVRDGFVTLENARVAYSVELQSDGDVDEAGTEERRAEIRRGRIGMMPSRVQAHPEIPGIAAALDAARRVWTCAYCRADLSPSRQDWRERTVASEALLVDRLAEAGMYTRARGGGPPVVLTEHFCPACAGRLVADMREEGAAAAAAPRLKRNHERSSDA